MRRRLACGGLLAMVSVLCCTSGGAVHAHALRERLRSLEIGQPAAQARAILGRDPVHKPGHPSDPFPSPRRTLALDRPSGGAVRVELYVVAASAAEGCPDVHYEDVPVAFVDERVAGVGWTFVESHWRDWGGTLAALREVRDGHQCPYPRDEAPDEPRS